MSDYGRVKPPGFWDFVFAPFAACFIAGLFFGWNCHGEPLKSECEALYGKSAKNEQMPKKRVVRKTPDPFGWED